MFSSISYFFMSLKQVSTDGIMPIALACWAFQVQCGIPGENRTRVLSLVKIINSGDFIQVKSAVVHGSGIGPRILTKIEVSITVIR